METPNLPAPFDPQAFRRDRARVQSGFWRKLRGAIARLPYAEEFVAAYFCAVDRATPLKVKAVLMGALAYFILPIDAVPDFIAGLGYTDDVTVLLGAIATVRASITDRHRDSARAALADLNQPPA